MLRKLITLLICFALFVSILPAFVLAETGPEEIPATELPEEAVTAALEEVKSDRDEFTKTYVDEEGQFTKEIYADPIHTEIDGEWTEISTDVKLDKVEGVLETESTQLEVAYPAEMSSDEKITYTVGNYNLEFSNITAGDGSKEFSLDPNATTRVEENKVFYEKVLPGIDLRHVSLNNEVKEDWIIQDYQGIHQFNYEVSTDLIAHLEEDGSIGFYEDEHLEKKVFKLPAPMMEDSNINEALGHGVKSTDLQYELSTLDNSRYAIQLVVDKKWLEEAERVFPIYVDPSVTIDALADSYVSSATPDTNLDKQWNAVYGEYVLKVGKYDASTGTNYAFVKFALTDLNGAIIDSASLSTYVTHTYSSTEKTGLWADKVNAPWLSGTVTWNNKPSSTNISSTSVGRDQWANFNVTQTIQKIADGSQGNYGFKFHTNGNGQTYWKQLSAAENANKTKIVINYHYSTMKSPTVTAAQYGDGLTNGYANVSWPAVYGATSYELQMFNGKTFEKVYAGTGTSWTSKGKKIFPLSPYSPTSIYKLDGTGTELVVDPSKFYSAKSGVATTRKEYGFKVLAKYESGSSPLSLEVKKALPMDQIDTPNMPIVKASAYPESDTVNKGRGWLDLSWEAVPGATGYKVLLYNGKTHEEISVGNVTSWSTKGQKIWPTDEEIAAGRFALHHDKLGAELTANPNPVYVNSGGTYTAFKRYAIRIKAESSLGVTPQSDSQYGYIPLAVPKNVKVTSTEIVDDVHNLGALNIQWDAVTDAGGYIVNFFDGVNYQQIDIGKVTNWSTKGISLFEGVESDLPADPTKEYKEVNTTNQTAVDRKAYVFNIQAYRHTEANSPDTSEKEKMEGYRGLGAKSANIYATIAVDASLLGLENYYTFGTHRMGNHLASINVTTGNMNISTTDHSLFTKAFSGFSFTRFYNSKSNQLSTLGNGWTFIGNESLEKKSLTSANINYWDEDGTSHEFVFNAATNSYASPKGKYLTLKETTVNNKTGFMLLNKDGLTKYFESDPSFSTKYRLQSYQDPHNNKILFSYIGSQLTEIAEVDATNAVIRNSIKLSYNAKGLLTKTSFFDRWIEYTYNDLNQLIGTIIKANGTTKTINYSYEYDEETGKVTSFKDGKGTVNTFSYEPNNLSILTPQADGKESIETTYLYNKSVNQYQVTDTQGRTTSYKRDSSNNTFAVNEIINQDNSITKTKYDLNYNELNKTDEFGHVEINQYDINGNLTSSIDKEGQKTTYTYNDKNQVIESTLPNGTKIVNKYSNYNLISSQVGEELSSYEYDSLGRVIKATNPNNTFTINAYDEASKKVTSTDVTGNVTSTTFNSFGQIISQTDGENRTTSFTLDLLNPHLKNSIMDGNGNLTSYDYDSNGNLTSLINPKGIKKTYKYDGNDQLVEVNLPISTTKILKVTKSYDEVGNLKTVKQNSGKTEDFVYDEVNQLTNVIVKNENGQNSLQSTNSYDVAGQLISKDFKNLSTNEVIVEKRMSYTIGNLLNIFEQGNYYTNYLYDEENRIKNQYVKYNNETETLNLEKINTFTEDGKISSIITQSGIEPLIRLDYTYDLKLNKTSVNLNDGMLKTTYSYDMNNNLTSVEYLKSSETNASLSFAYQYDKSRNIIKETTTSGTTQYYYDKKNQLSKEVLPNGETKEYYYDVTGNRVKDIQNNKETIYTYNEGNQMVTKNNASFTYDLDGNLAKDDKFNYHYSDLGVLIRVETLSNQQVAKYEHDENGLRTKKTVGSKTYEYFYDGEDNNLTLEVIKENNQIQSYRYYQWDQNGKVTGMIIKSKDANDVWQINAYYFITNSRGHIISIIDRDGIEVGSYTYDAFGNILNENGLIAKENSIRYSSYYYDQETKNYYLKARYYNPEFGNFQSLDPYAGSISDSQTQNGYNYANNNPVMLIDPTGEAGVTGFKPYWWGAKIFLSTNAIKKLYQFTGGSALTYKAVEHMASIVKKSPTPLLKAAVSVLALSYIAVDVSIYYANKKKRGVYFRLNKTYTPVYYVYTGTWSQ